MANQRERSRSPVSRRDYQAPREGSRNDRKADRRGGFARRERVNPETAPVDRNYEKSLFVGNIPFESTSKDIRDMFSKEFKIVRAEVAMLRGRSRGLATVELESQDDIESAINKFNGTQIRGREILVRRDRAPPGERKRGEEREGRSEVKRERDEGNPESNEVFVSNLSYDTTWRGLKDLMRKAAPVQRADVYTNKLGRSRGVGSVIFNTAAEASAAIKKFDGYNFDGRELELRHGRDVEPVTPANANANAKAHAKPTRTNSEFTEGVQGKGAPSSLIYADNLPFITSQQDLFELFQSIGHVTKAEIQYNASGRPNGTAVVEFESQELAESAINNLNGYSYGGRSLGVSYAARPSADVEMQDEDENVQDETASAE